MSITYHERPGVYSDYEASSVHATGSGGSVLGLVGYAQNPAGLYTVTSAADGAALGGDLPKMLRLMFENGAAKVLVSPAAAKSAAAYKTALERLLMQREAAYCVFDTDDETIQLAMAEAICTAASQKGECIGLVGMSSPTVSQLTARASALNCERMVLVGPDVQVQGDSGWSGGWMAAAALAGVLAAETDPAAPVHGSRLAGLTSVSHGFTESEIDLLVRGGVTPLELTGGAIEVIRTVTTRTKTDGAADSTYRELNTMRVIDEVIPAIRTALSARFLRAKNNRVTRNAIRTQVLVELENRVSRQIIDSYGPVTVTPSETDPTCCEVAFPFTVTSGLCRIFLTAHISV